MLVSIIITTHKGRKDMCKRAIESVLAQTYQDIEIIVVDDAAKDGTRKMVAEYPVKYVERKRNFGNHSRPKNEGILASTGDLVGFLDSDNVYRPDHVQVLVNAFKKDQYLHLAYGDRMIIQDGKATGIGRNADFDPALILQTPFIDTSDFLIKREALFYLGGWDESHKRMLDWNLTTRAAKAGFNFAHIKTIITDYHIHGDMLSNQVEQDMFSTYDCPIQLPYLGEVKKPVVAIFSLVYQRPEYTQRCFESMYETADYPFEHVVVCQTPEDAELEYKEGTHLIKNEQNRGISIASNQAVDYIQRNIKADIIIKVDNDCLFLTHGWLKKMIELWGANRRIALSPYVQGLVDNPGGAPRLGYGDLCGELIGVTQHLGGICHFVGADAYKLFRWDETQPLHGIQDLEFSNYLVKSGWQMGYMENYFVEHIDGTSGQAKRYPEYFERRKQEKTTVPERSYEEIQKRESAPSEGTIWGDRVKDSVNILKEYFKGRVLDLGCGDGVGVAYLGELGIEAHGIDLNEDKVAIAREKMLDVQVGRMEELAFANKSFDTIFCSHTLEHAQDILKASSEIQRVGRRLILIVPIEESTTNTGHTSKIDDKEVVKRLFKGKVIHEQELGRLEREYVLVMDLE